MQILPKKFNVLDGIVILSSEVLVRLRKKKKTQRHNTPQTVTIEAREGQEATARQINGPGGCRIFANSLLLFRVCVPGGKMRPNEARPRNHISRRTTLFPIPLRSGQNTPFRVAGVKVRVGVTLNSLFAVNWPAGKHWQRNQGGAWCTNSSTYLPKKNEKRYMYT